MLKGEVDSSAEKARAERLARRAGAQQVDNRLSVDGARTEVDRRDGDLGDRAEARSREAIRGAEERADRTEERAERAKDRADDKAERTKDRIDDQAKAAKQSADDKAERTKEALDRKVDDARGEARRGDGDRPFDGK